MFKHKLKASLIHLGLSILLVGLVIGSLLFFFFPQLFIGVSDFKEIAMIIISVDLILGPLLTFVVFQPKKKTLIFDLSVIAAIQLSALVYGAYALYEVHPVYVTFNIDRFTIVSAKDAEPEKAQYDEYKVSKLTTGKLAFARMPVDIEKRNDIALGAAMGAGDLDIHTEYYEPYENNIDQVLARSLDPKLIFSNEDSKQKAKDFYNEHQNNLNEFAYLPLNSQKKDAIIVLDKITAQPVATLNIDPWELSKK